MIQTMPQTKPDGGNAPQIDLVCCWVRLDGQYEHSLQQHVGGVGHTPGAHAGRFRELGELTYSIPMAIRYMPWLRRVFIVTNGQRPPQSVLDEPKVRWVTHADIIPERFLPTFNYHAIMPFLGCIPDLAEWFVSTSDDFFVTRPLSPQDLLGRSGKGRFYHTRQPLRVAEPANNWQHNLRRSDAALEAVFGALDRRVFPHAPQIFNRDAWLASLERFAGDVEDTARFKVRAPTGRIFRVLHTYDYLYGLWGAADQKELHRRSGGDVAFINRSDACTVALRRLDDDLRTRLAALEAERPTFFCLNDNIAVDQFDAVKGAVLDTLERMF